MLYFSTLSLKINSEETNWMLETVKLSFVSLLFTLPSRRRNKNDSCGTHVVELFYSKKFSNKKNYFGVSNTPKMFFFFDLSFLSCKDHAQLIFTNRTPPKNICILLWHLTLHDWTHWSIYGAKYSRIDQVKSVQDNL